MNFAIIGGGGFLGSTITEELLSVGEDVTVFDMPGAIYLNYLANKGAKILTGNFLDAKQLNNVFTNKDIVFHLVSTTVPKTSNENPIQDIETNLAGTVNLFAAAKDAGVKKVVFASSGGTVYGIPREIPINENHPTEPISSYGIVKLAIEKYAHLFWKLYGLNYGILRISNAYGERQPWNRSQGVIPMIVSNALKDTPLNIWGDGTAIKDFIYARDVAKAFLKMSYYEGEQKIFNIGSGIGLCVNDLIKLTEEILAKPLRVTYKTAQNYDVPVNVLDITKAQNLLKWNVETDIRQGLNITIKYMRDHM